MLGAPYEGILSVPGIASKMLGDVVHGRRVRVVNLASSRIAGMSLSAQLLRLAEVIK